MRNQSTDKQFFGSKMRKFNLQINYVIYYHLLIVFYYFTDLILSIKENNNIKNINIEIRPSINTKND